MRVEFEKPEVLRGSPATVPLIFSYLTNVVRLGANGTEIPSHNGSGIEQNLESGTRYIFLVGEKNQASGLCRPPLLGKLYPLAPPLVQKRSLKLGHRAQQIQEKLRHRRVSCQLYPMLF